MFKAILNSIVSISMVLLLGVSFSAKAEADTLLTLKEAERQALLNDPMLASSDALAEALEEAAVADGQLPDPQMKVSLFNYPTDTFEFSQEPITQFRFGVQQHFPRGDTLAYKSRQTLSMAQGARANSADANLKIIRDVRKNWLERYYWLQTERIVSTNRKLFNQLVDVTQSQYASGRRNQQDVLRAELELGLLDDRLSQIRQQQRVAEAALGKWIGGDALRPLPAELPELQAVPALAQIEARLANHPTIQSAMANVEANQNSVRIAREAYKPAWTFGVDYGVRDGENAVGVDRPDFLTATLQFDVPLFTSKRQDKRLTAAQKRNSAALSQRDDKYREMQQMLNDNYARWQSLAERIQRYDDSLIFQARESSKATYNAYQSDATDFATLMRANITELNTRLQALRLRVDRAKVQAQLLYLAGEKS
jgi:outer membrane protein TolC